MTAVHLCHFLSRQGAGKRPRPLLLNAQTHALAHGECMLQRLQILKFQPTDMPLARTHMPGIHQQWSETDPPLGNADKGPRRPQGTQRDERVAWFRRGQGCQCGGWASGSTQMQSTSDAKVALPSDLSVPEVWGSRKETSTPEREYIQKPVPVPLLCPRLTLFLETLPSPACGMTGSLTSSRL